MTTDFLPPFAWAITKINARDEFVMDAYKPFARKLKADFEQYETEIDTTNGRLVSYAELDGHTYSLEVKSNGYLVLKRMALKAVGVKIAA